MNKIRVLILLSAFCAVFAEPSSAQFGNLLGGLKGGGSSPESLVKGYTEGAQMVLKAQERLLTAVGKKEEAAKAALQAENLTKGATEQSLSDAARDQSANSQILQESFNAQGTTMDAQSKVVYAQGLGLLGKGTARYLALVPEARGFKPTIAAVSPGTLQSAAFVAKTLPDNATNLQGTLSAAVKYGQSQGVEVPADATAALK